VGPLDLNGFLHLGLLLEFHFDNIQGQKTHFLSVPLLWGPAIALQRENPIGFLFQG